MRKGTGNMEALIGVLIILIGFGVFFICWGRQCLKISKETDYRAAEEIADDIILHARVRIFYQTVIKDEMNRKDD